MSRANPYAPPVTDDDHHGDSAISSRRPSGAPSVFGALSIAFGLVTLILVASWFMLPSMADLMSDDIDSPEMRRAIAQAWEQYSARRLPLFIGEALTYSSLSLALIAIGLGQFQYRRWARRATLFWSTVALFTVGAQIAAYVLFGRDLALHLLGELQAAIPEGAPPGVQAIKALAAGFTGPVVNGLRLVLDLPYPLIMLWWFRRPAARQALIR